MSTLDTTNQPVPKIVRSFQTFFAKPRLAQRLWRKFLSIFFLEKWIILISARKDAGEPSWADFKPIIPPRDRLWADPFPWTRDGRTYIFVEELIYSNKRGHISCLMLDEHLNIVSNSIVLQRPYHLSYPFIFSYSGQLYMVPETKENCSIELYRCVEFPDCWEFEKTLVKDIKALDTTLFEYDGRWWLFVNVEEGDGQRDALHLYYADTPLSDHWIPLPGNPVVKDIRSARPAGRIFSRGQALFRPSQDCSVRYGYAINFNRIIDLSEADYCEEREWVFKPPRTGDYVGTHTWNETDTIKVIDAILRRRRF
jgi:hypothetical protein